MNPLQNNAQFGLLSDDLEEIVTELSAMLAVMPRAGAASADDMKAIMKIYLSDLSELPPDLVKQVIVGYRRGVYGDGRFAPTPAQIGMTVRHEIELDRIRRTAVEYAKPLIRVERNSAAGRAWEAYNNSIGVTNPWPNDHWFFASMYPPGHKDGSE